MGAKLKVLVAIISFSTVFYSCKDKEQSKNNKGFVVNGTVKGLDNSYAKITDYQFFNSNPNKVIDSVAVVNGKFELTGEVAFPDMVTLEIGDYKTNFFIENSTIKISVDVSNVKSPRDQVKLDVVGSLSHSKYKALEEQTSAVFSDKKYDVFKEVREMFAKAKEEGNEELLNEALKKQEGLQDLAEERNARYKNIKFDFVKANPSNTISPYVLGVQYTEGRMTREQLKEFYAIFKGNARKTTFFKTFITKIYKDNFENVGVGNTAPDFTLNTNTGEELTLSNVKGKYILVDFWASWCAPCRASFPHLKELRKQYKDKGFTIVGVGTADEKEKWEKAIEEDQTPWNHVYDTSENHSYGPVARSYGVPHLPTTLLVDSNRKIVLRNPTKEELDSKLKELLGH